MSSTGYNGKLGSQRDNSPKNASLVAKLAKRMRAKVRISPATSEEKMASGFAGVDFKPWVSATAPAVVIIPSEFLEREERMA